MFYVLDQNVMRKSSLAHVIQSQPDASFIVPDTAFVEMVKSERWEQTMRQSFAALASAVDRTFVSLAVSDAIRHERANWKPVDRASLLPEEFATCIRELITGLTSADGSPALAHIRVRINALRSDLLAKEADPVAEKKDLVRLIALLEAACGPAMAKDMRNRRMSREAQLGLIQSKAEEMLIRDVGVPRHEAEVFRRTKPLHLRHIYLRLRHAMW